MASRKNPDARVRQVQNGYHLSTKVTRMGIGHLIVVLLIGAVSGFLAGNFMKGSGFGLLGNMIVGIVGSAITSIVFGNLNLLGSAILNQIAGGTLGAIILLYLLSLIGKSPRP